MSTEQDKAELNAKLLKAIQQRKVDQACDLLELGASPNLRDQVGFTLLFKASCLASPRLLFALFMAGADVNNRNDNAGTTALHCAARDGRGRTMKMLLAIGGDAYQLDTSSPPMNPLEYAIAAREVASVRFLDSADNRARATREGRTMGLSDFFAARKRSQAGNDAKRNKQRSRRRTAQRLR